MKALGELAREQKYLTADDLHDRVEDPDPGNRMGDVFLEAAAIGLILDTGRMYHSKRPEAKNRKITLWISTYHRNPHVADPDPLAEYIQQRREGSGAEQQTLL